MSDPQSYQPNERLQFATDTWVGSPGIKVAAVVLLAGVLPVLISLVMRSMTGSEYVYALLHECLELAGTCIAVAVATLLWLRSQYERDAPHLLWAAAALVAMGLIDGAHAVAPFGVAWSWFRHGATLAGGLLFAMVWLPAAAVPVRRRNFLLVGVTALALTGAVLVAWKPGLMPAPWRAGNYTFAVKAANGLGGLGFFAAAVFFLRRYLRWARAEDIVLASQTLLFAVAGVMFGYSHVWHAGWWVWHGARLAAYGILLITAYQVMQGADQEPRRLNEAVGRERQRLTNVLDMLPAYVVLLSQDYQVPFANAYFEERFGKSEGRRCYEYLFQRSEPCENCESFKPFQTKAPHHWEWLGPDGRYYSIQDMPFTDTDSSLRVMEMGIDITERKQAEEKLRYLNRSLRALSDCNQLLLHAPDEQTLLDGVCRILVEHCGHALAWVGYPQQDEAKSVRVIAAECTAKDHLTPGLVSWADEERGRRPTGMAIRTGKAVVLEDASTDPRFGPWREQALSRGFHSSVCLPVPIGESQPAALTIYSTQTGAFHDEELQLLEELAQDLGYGVRMLRTRAQRDWAEQQVSHLAAIVESSDDAIYSKDLEGTILTWNHGAEKMYGYTAQEIVGQPVWRLAAPEHGEEISELLQRIKTGQTVEHYETVRMRKDGTRCDVSITLSPVRDSQGQITGASSIARDITARKQAERRLAEQQFYTRSLIEASLDPLVTISREGKITDVNRATESVTGVSREQLIGSDFSDYFTDPDEARAGYHQVFSDGYVQDYPLVIRHTSGRVTDVLYNATVFRNQKGEVEGVFAAARDITERKRAERRLQEQQFYTRSLIEASLDPLVTISRDGKITDVNRAAEAVTGVTRGQLIGTDFCDYFSEPEEARAGYQQAFADGFVQDYPLAIRHTSGRLTHVLYNATVYSNEKGEVEGVFAAARDVTARKRAEAALQASEQRYRSLVTATAQVVWSTDADGQVEDMPMWRALTGQTLEQVRGWGWLNAVHPDDRERAQAVWSQALRTRGLYNAEYRVRRHDGEYRDFWARGVPVLAADAKTIREWIGTCTDITERKRSEQRIAEQQFYTRSLIETSLGPLVTISREGKITDVNRATEAVTGVARAQLIGTEFSDYFTEPEKARAGYQQVFADGFVQDYPLAIRHTSGRLTDVLYNATVFRNQKGEVEGVFAAARDITARKQAQDELQRYARELERSNAELQDFASIASHDLQEPLRKVLAFGEHLKDHLGDNLDELGKDFLTRMQNAAQRMSGLIQALLEYSRVTTRAQPFQPVDLTQLMFEVLVDMEERISGSHAQVDFAPMPKVMADPTQVRQLLQNLLGNALKFQKPGQTPRVVVEGRSVDGRQSAADGQNQTGPASTVDRRPSTVEITVRDNGIGFDEKYLDRIFRPFQRLHGRSEYEGSGMGLAICRKVVARHGGTITAHSQPGQGSTFAVTLPSANGDTRRSTLHSQPPLDRRPSTAD